MRDTGEVALPETKKSKSSESERSEYLSSIVSAATLAPPGVEVNTMIRCRRRPERKACHGFIRLRLQEDPAQLNWWCPVCADSGLIRNWKGIPWNLSHTRGATFSNGAQFGELLLTESEFRLLSEIEILEPRARKIVHDATVIKDGGGMSLWGTMEVIDELMGYIAFEANQEQRKKRQHALNQLFDKINNCISAKW